MGALDRIRQQLEDEISGGQLKPGDPLEESVLAARFRVSRTPVREALLQLAAQGLVTIVPRSGTYVTKLSIKDLLALFELLAELEGVCAKLAAKRIDPAAQAELRGIHEESRSAVDSGDADAYAGANTRFHELLYSASCNRYLAEQILRIRRRTQFHRESHFQDRRRLPQSWEEHGRILRAVAAGDTSEAGRAALEHISIGGREFAEFVSRMPEGLLEL
ncbi:MAG: GntR family transcriptional regulator [Deltaproteobacteria bacterium]|nr:GntR family transcriptional regulator [Deltaproteobacteria bacterium]